MDGIYEPETVRFLTRRIPHNGILLDLGMNIGSISMPLCRVRPDIRVIGMEASPHVYPYLERNIKENDLSDRIRIYQNAVCDVDDTSLPYDDNAVMFGQSSLSLEPDAGTVIVPAIRIDTFLTRNAIGRVDFIKIDIEGFEYQAFVGADKLLSGDDSPDLLFEFGDWAERRAGLEVGSAQRQLREFGYETYKVHGNRLERLDSPLTSGFAMLYATKRKQS